MSLGHWLFIGLLVFLFSVPLVAWFADRSYRRRDVTGLGPAEDVAGLGSADDPLDVVGDVLVRVRRSDRTLEPEISVFGEDMYARLHSVFRLQGRMVQVIGYERENDGSIRCVIVEEGSEPRFQSAAGHEAYLQIHPIHVDDYLGYGTLILDGRPLQVGEVENESIHWSRDGRYLAVIVQRETQLYGVSVRERVQRNVILIDAESRKVVRGSKRPGLYVAAQYRRMMWGPGPFGTS